MSRIDPVVCLYIENVSDLQAAMDMAKQMSYTRIITRVTQNPQSGQREIKSKGDKFTAFTRSDLLLSGEQWRRNVVHIVGEASECESQNKTVQKLSILNLKQEIDWVKHLDSIACLLVPLKDDNACNLCRQLLNRFDQQGCVLAETSIVDKTFFTQKYSRTVTPVDLSVASATIWQRWNQFRIYSDFNMHFKVVLELTPTLPNEADLSRWYGEPVEMIIIPSDMFEETSNNNSLILKDPYREVCLQFAIRTRAHFAVRCNQDNPWIDSYPKVLKAVLNSVKKADEHECNKNDVIGLKLPLNMESTMNKCAKYEKVMHNRYEKALKLAIKDRINQSEKINVIICGTNGWNLLDPVMSLMQNSTDMQLFIFEEDASVRITINETIEHLYAGCNITILADTKNEQYHHQMDIVMSVTSEAIYESQWLKLNFDRIKTYIRPDAILIPKQTTLTIVPVTAAKVGSFLQHNETNLNRHETAHKLQSYTNRAQIIYPLYTRNFYECATSLELFSFNYSCNSDIQIRSDARSKMLNFKIERDCMVTGFLGYFQSTLYKNITLNNRTMIKDNNEDCVPMAYFPLKSPSILKSQSELQTHFRLNFNAETNKYWYEWKTTSPISMIHNLNGEVCALHNPFAHFQ